MAINYGSTVLYMNEKEVLSKMLCIFMYLTWRSSDTTIHMLCTQLRLRKNGSKYMFKTRVNFEASPKIWKILNLFDPLLHCFVPIVRYSTIVHKYHHLVNAYRKGWDLGLFARSSRPSAHSKIFDRPCVKSIDYSCKLLAARQFPTTKEELPNFDGKADPLCRSYRPIAYHRVQRCWHQSWPCYSWRPSDCLLSLIIATLLTGNRCHSGPFSYVYC